MDGKKSDVIIIGGGIIGLSVAYYATLAGADVTILERGNIGLGCSGGNAGLIGRSYLEPLPSPGIIKESCRNILNSEGFFGITPRLDNEFLRWAMGFLRSCNKKHFAYAVDIFSQINNEALKTHLELADLGGDQYNFKTNGLLVIFGKSDRFKQAYKRAERAIAKGIPCKVLSREEVLNQVSALDKKVIGGIHYSKESTIDPMLFLHWISGQINRHGAKIVPGAEVYGFKTSQNQVKTVLTTKGDYTAEQVVLASGAWLNKTCHQLGCKVPIEGGKGISVTFSAPHKIVDQSLLIEDCHVAITPFAKTLRIAGVLELAGLDSSLNVRRMKGVLRSACRYLPDLQKLKVDEIWRGIRPCTPDGLPVLGRLTSWKNVLVAGGHDGRGLSLGPVTGKYVAGLLGGDSIGNMEKRLSPKRFQSS